MNAIRVGVLRGGPSHEYGVSLKTGGSVLRNLPSHYKPQDILIDRSGNWHCNGLPTTPAKLRQQVDVIFNALHGRYGEDGQVQNLLDQTGIPYTGSGHMASSFGMNKVLAKELFAKQGIRTPRGFIIELDLDPENAADEIFQRLSPPWIIKPVSGGSSLGLYLAKNYFQLIELIKEARNFAQELLIEEYIRGSEATCGVVENFRDAEHYVLLPIEIVRPNKDFWDYDNKYNGQTDFVCPARFSEEISREIGRLATEAHKAIGARHYSRTDFIVSPRGIYVLEINTLPGLTEHSLMPKSLAAVGCNYPQFLDHLIKMALN